MKQFGIDGEKLICSVPAPSSGHARHGEDSSAFKIALRSFLDDASFYPHGGILGFGFYHEYPCKLDDTQPISSAHLKGRDVIVYSACQELGLPVRTTYLFSEGLSEGLQVLCDHIGLTNCFYSDSDAILVEQLKEKGQFLRGDERAAYSYSDSGSESEDQESNKDNDGSTDTFCEDLTIPQSAWVKKPNKLNTKREAMFVYGNEARLQYCYGRGCLIVEIGKPGERETGEWEPVRPKKRKLEERKNYYY